MARFAASRRDLGVRPPAASLAAGSLPQVPSGCAFHGATFPGNIASQGVAFNGEAFSGGFIECRKQEIHSAVQPVPRLTTVPARSGRRLEIVRRSLPERSGDCF